MRWTLLAAVCLLALVCVSEAANLDRAGSRTRTKHRVARAQTDAALEKLARVAVAAEKKIDPRRYDTDPDMPIPPEDPTAYFSFFVGKKYTYRFKSTAAHMDQWLPNPDKVNPQAQLESFGLFPYAVLEGSLIVEGACITADRRMLLRASLKDIRSECVNEPGFNNACDTLDQIAANISTYPFWLTHNSNGEIIAMDFNKGDSLEMMAIKQNLVRDLSLTVTQKGETPEVFARYYSSGNFSMGTRYRIRPFTRHANTDDRVEGVVVRKDRASKRPSAGVPLPNEDPFMLERHSWVFMIIGGDIAPAFGPAPVPSYVAMMEETQLDPAKLKLIQNNTNTADVYVLSHLELSLRSILPGVDNTSNLLINGTCGISELDAAADVFFRPSPPLSFVELEAAVTSEAPAVPMSARSARASSSGHVHREMSDLEFADAKPWFAL